MSKISSYYFLDPLLGEWQQKAKNANMSKVKKNSTDYHFLLSMHLQSGLDKLKHHFLLTNLLAVRQVEASRITELRGLLKCLWYQILLLTKKVWFKQINSPHIMEKIKQWLKKQDPTALPTITKSLSSSSRWNQWRWSKVKTRQVMWVAFFVHFSCENYCSMLNGKKILFETAGIGEKLRKMENWEALEKTKSIWLCFRDENIQMTEIQQDRDLEERFFSERFFLYEDEKTLGVFPLPLGNKLVSPLAE